MPINANIPAPTLTSLGGSNATSGYNLGFSWRPASGINKYNLYASTTSPVELTEENLITTQQTFNTQQQTRELRILGGTYYFALTSVSATGTEQSPASNEIQAIIPVVGPNNVSVVTNGSGELTVSWGAAPGATSYHIMYTTMETGDSCTLADTCNMMQYRDRVNQLELCGGSNWDVPTLFELVTITHFGKRTGSRCRQKMSRGVLFAKPHRFATGSPPMASQALTANRVLKPKKAVTIYM